MAAYIEKIHRFAGGTQEMNFGLGRFIGSVNCVHSFYSVILYWVMYTLTFKCPICIFLKDYMGLKEIST